MNLIVPASPVRDALQAALDEARRLHRDTLGLVGYGVAHLVDGDGKTKQLLPFTNLITDAGDAYIAAKVIAGVAPAEPADPTAASGMKLGTDNTAAAKSGGGAALGAYISGSNVVFDATYPQTSNLGSGQGVTAVYRSTWGAGVATEEGICEAVIVNDAGTDSTSTAGNTYSRVVLTPIDKGSDDSLTITWAWKFLGEEEEE